MYVVKRIAIMRIMGKMTSVSGFDYDEIRKKLSLSKNDSDLFHAITNLPFEDKLQTSLIFLGIIVLLLVNKKDGMIDRISVTDNDLAAGTKKMSVKKFEEIRIPVGYPENIIAQAIETGEPKETRDWKYLFAPDLTPEEARFNQAGGGIGFSAVYPLIGIRDGGAMIFSYYMYPEDSGEVQEEFMGKYRDLVAEALSR